MPLTKEGNDGQPRPMKPTTTDVVGDEVGKKLQQAPATVIESPKGSTPPAIDEKPGSEKEVVDDSTKNHHEVPKDAKQESKEPEKLASRPAPAGMNGNNEINWQTAKKGWQSVGKETSTLTDTYTKMVKMTHFLRLRRVGKMALSQGDNVTFLVKKKKQHAGVVRIFTGQGSPNKWAANHYYVCTRVGLKFPFTFLQHHFLLQVLAGIIERRKLTFQVVLFDSCEFHKARYFEGSENLKLLKDAWDADGPRAIMDYFQDDFDSSFTEKASGPRLH